MPRRGPMAATARPFAFPLSWSVTVCAGVAILALCAAIYGTIGYVDEKRLADAERLAAEHAMRTNADLQRQLDRARDESPAPQVSPPTAFDRPPPPLIAALGPADARLSDAQLPDPLSATVAD